jgi:hypothetical protein
MKPRKLLSMCLGVSIGILLAPRYPCSAEPRDAQTQPSNPRDKTRVKDEPLFLAPPDGVSRITFACDASGSLRGRFTTIRRELAKTIEAMPPSTMFGIVFMREKGCTPFDAQLLAATPKARSAAVSFLEDTAGPRGETDPLPALDLAFKQEPQFIHLLTDGDFPDNSKVLARIRELNKDHKVRINTIALDEEDEPGRDYIKLLKTIATENGGIFRHVKESEL